MTEWLLLLVILSGGKVDQMVVSRLPAEEACEAQGVTEVKKHKKGSASFVCFEVARLPKTRPLNPVIQPKN